MATSYRERRTEQALQRYYDSYLMNLADCYKTCSDEKLEAWTYCVNRCSELKGWGLKVVSYNTNVFTAGFFYQDSKSIYFYYITKDWEYSIKVW